MQDISSRMDAVCRRFEELSIRLNQPDTAADPALSPVHWTRTSSR